MEDALHMEEALKVLHSSLSFIKWRLRPSSRRRLETDILALCTGMRAVIMVDYGGKMPELQERLCSFLKNSQKESSIFENLRVMVIEDMIYLVHLKGIAELVKSTLNSETQLNFLDIEHDPPKMITQAEESSIGKQLMSVQKHFSLIFPFDAAKNESLQSNNCESSVGEFIDISSCMQNTEVTMPTLNGWLLGYPLVYLFSKENITDAIHNLSTKSLHLFKISVTRSDTSTGVSREEELMSFTVPYEMSVEGRDEPWAQQFVAHLQARREACKHIWGSLKMEVTSCFAQAIAL